MGRVDGLVLEIEEGKPPRVHHLQLGGIVLARRIHPLAARLVLWLHERFGVRRTAEQIIHWPVVGEIAPHKITLGFDGNDTVAFDWERWLRDNIVDRLPKARK